MGKLGELIGSVRHTFKVTNEAEEPVTINVEFDFSNSTDDDIRGWLAANRAIALQRPLRSLSAKEIEELNGAIIDAVHAGRKLKSKKERFLEGIAALRAAGMEEEASRLLSEWKKNNN